MDANPQNRFAGPDIDMDDTSQPPEPPAIQYNRKLRRSLTKFYMSVPDTPKTDPKPKRRAANKRAKAARKRNR